MHITVEPNLNKGETRLSMYRVTVLDDQSNMTTCFVPICYLKEQYASYKSGYAGATIFEAPLEWENPDAVRTWLLDDPVGKAYLEEILPIFAWNGEPEEFEDRLRRIEKSLEEVEKWEDLEW